MDDATGHAFATLSDLDSRHDCSAETSAAPELKKVSDQQAPAHSPYDLGANDKLTRAERARVRREAATEVALLKAEGITVTRPQTRKDCLPGGCNETRPCPYVGCKFHLYLEVSKETGALNVNLPGVEPWELSESCALDVVEREHGVTLEAVGALMNRTRERVRQIESGGLRKLKKSLHLPVLND